MSSSLKQWRSKSHKIPLRWSTRRWKAIPVLAQISSRTIDFRESKCFFRGHATLMEIDNYKQSLTWLSPLLSFIMFLCPYTSDRYNWWMWHGNFNTPLNGVTQIWSWLFPGQTVTVFLRRYAVIRTLVLLSCPLFEYAFTFLISNWLYFWLSYLLTGLKVRILKSSYVIGYQ
jgi:hypothetical protein